MENSIYKYSITIEYELEKDNIIKYSTNRIHNLLIDYDYINKNMPVLYLKAAIDKNVLDDMKKNIGKKTLILTVNKYLKDVKPRIEKKYIKDEFVYFLDNNVNTRQDLDYSKKEIEEGKELHELVTIGLAKLDLINNNKKIINEVFLNTSPINMICKNLSHMKLLIEPLTNNKIMKRLIIPPLDTVTKFIKYLDDNQSLYSTKYRLFYDFDKTYLLSSSGNKVESKDEEFSSVIINIHDTIDKDSKKEGIKIDKKNKTYILEADSVDTNVLENVHTNISINNILAIGHDGETKNVDIKSANSKIKNVKIARFRNDNLNKINEYKRDVENKISININKSDLDSSIFTINKEYNIRNFKNLKDKDGKYLLNRKRDIFIREGEEFKLVNLLTFDQIVN